MDEKVEVLLNKINMGKESFPYFSSAKLTKIKIHRKTLTWDVFISLNTMLPLEVIKKLEQYIDSADKTENDITCI